MNKILRLERYIEYAIIIILLVLNILEFFSILPPLLRLFSKLFSFSVFFYVFYHLSFMRIFFGKGRHQCITHNSRIKNYQIDLLILFCFALMSLNNILNNSFYLEYLNPEKMYGAAFEEIFFLLFINRVNVINLSMIAGVAILFLMSIFLGIKVKFQRPSLMSVIHEDFFPHNFKEMLSRSIIVFISLTGFFIIVFKIFFEWFIFVMETPFAFVAIVSVIIFLKNRHHKGLKRDNPIYRLGNFVEDFYTKVIELVHQKTRIMHLFSFILVLHLVTDFFTFIVPFVLGSEGGIYHFQNTSLISMISSDLASSEYPLGTIWIYLCLVFIMLVFILMPYYIWKSSHSGKGLIISRILLGIYYAAFFIFFTRSVFNITLLSSGEIIGVNFLFERTEGFYLGTEYVFIISAIIFFLVFTFSVNRPIKTYLTLAGLIPIMYFFTKYIAIFCLSLSIYYYRYITFLMIENQLVLMSIMCLFFLISILFYITGFFSFLLNLKYDIKKELM